MTTNTLIFAEAHAFDTIEVEALIKRLDLIIPRFANCSTSAWHSTHEDDRSDPASTPGAVAHLMVYYFAGNDDPMTPDAEVAVTSENGRDNLRISLFETDNTRVMTIHQPLAPDLSNYIAPDSMGDVIQARLLRFRDLLSRVLICSTADDPHRMYGPNAITRAQAMMAAIIAAGRPADGSYRIVFPSPFGPGQIFYSSDYFKQEPCLTPAGQEAFADSLCLFAKMTSEDTTLVLEPTEINSDFLFLLPDSPVEQMLLLNELPADDLSSLTIPYSREV